jgi:hypothetical protein
MVKKLVIKMTDTELLREINEKLDNLILAISVSGKSFQEQVNYLTNLGYKPQRISNVIGRSRQSVKDMVKSIKGKKIIIGENEITLRLDALIRLISESSEEKQKITKSIYYLKSIGIPQIEISKIFGIKPSSIPSYIRQFQQLKNKKNKK